MYPKSLSSCVPAYINYLSQLYKLVVPEHGVQESATHSILNFIRFEQRGMNVAGQYRLAAELDDRESIPGRVKDILLFHHIQTGGEANQAAI